MEKIINSDRYAAITVGLSKPPAPVIAVIAYLFMDIRALEASPVMEVSYETVLYFAVCPPAEHTGKIHGA